MLTVPYYCPFFGIFQHNPILACNSKIPPKNKRARLSHKDNAVTTQGSYQCGIHAFSSKMAAHEILKDLRRVKPVLSTELAGSRSLL